MHLQALVGTASARPQQAQQPAATSFSWLPNAAQHGQQQAGARSSCAWLLAPPGGTGSYRVHPALGDASIHLAAVPAAAQDGAQALR